MLNFVQITMCTDKTIVSPRAFCFNISYFCSFFVPFPPFWPEGPVNSGGVKQAWREKGGTPPNFMGQQKGGQGEEEGSKLTAVCTGAESINWWKNTFRIEKLPRNNIKKKAVPTTIPYNNTVRFFLLEFYCTQVACTAYGILHTLTPYYSSVSYIFLEKYVHFSACPFQIYTSFHLPLFFLHLHKWP